MHTGTCLKISVWKSIYQDPNLPGAKELKRSSRIIHSLIINTKINQWPYSYGAAAKRPSFENATDADDGYLLKAEEAFDDFHRLSHDTWYLNILGLDSLQFGANKRDINISGGPERFGLISKDSTEAAGADAVPVQ